MAKTVETAPKPVVQEIRRPLVDPVAPSQVASFRTEPLDYDPMNRPLLAKCLMKRKVRSSGKTGFIVGYDLSSKADPRILVEWAGEFEGDGHAPIKLSVTA